MRSLTSLVLLMAAALPVSAVEFDVRLTAGTAAVIDELEVDGVGGQDIEADVSGSGSLTAHAFFGDGLLGFMVGGGLRAAAYAGEQQSAGSFPADGAELTYETMALQVEAGLTIRPFPRWRIEARPQIAVGQGELEVEVDGDTQTGDAGDYLSVSGVIGNYLRFNWFEIGLDLAYESFSGKSEIAGAGTETTGEGITVQLGIGVVF